MSAAPYARLIVCEPKPRWAVLLRRYSKETPASEARSLVLASEMLTASPGSFIAVATNESKVAALLERLGQWRRDFPAITTAVLLDAPNDELELGFREAGAQLVIASLFDLLLVVRLAERHFAHVEEPVRDWREAVMARMPWPAAGRSP